MIQRSICLHPFEVRALLAERLSQLRRPVKPQPPVIGRNGGRIISVKPSSLGYGWDATYSLDDPYYLGACPFGAPGDVLAGKERIVLASDNVWHYDADETPVMTDINHCGEMLVWAHHNDREACPAYQMPAWAVRWKLPLISVRVERAKDISEADARACGICDVSDCRYPKSHVPMYLQRWEQTYGKRFPWESAWAWVLDVETRS